MNFISRLSNKDLAKIAAVGGIIVTGSGYLMKKKMRSNFRETPYIKDAVTSLKAHKPLLNYLGEPVSVGNVTFGKEDYAIVNKAHFQLPIKGQTHEGILYLDAYRPEIISEIPESNPQEGKELEKKYGKWILSSLQVSIKGRDPFERILVPIISSEDTVDSNISKPVILSPSSNQSIPQ